MDDNKRRFYTEEETFYINSVVQMLEEALELMGDRILFDMENRIENMNQDETLEEMKNIRKNIYSIIAGYPEKLEQEYEEFKADPETQARVQQMMDEAQLDHVVSDDDDGDNNGNLQ